MTTTAEYLKRNPLTEAEQRFCRESAHPIAALIRNIYAMGARSWDRVMDGLLLGALEDLRKLPPEEVSR
jgi:hypothetical protein